MRRFWTTGFPAVIALGFPLIGTALALSLITLTRDTHNLERELRTQCVHMFNVMQAAIAPNPKTTLAQKRISAAFWKAAKAAC